MKSFERSHKSRDLDQRDPEHLSRETNEFNWDDLKSVPFSGDTQSIDLQGLINDLPTDDESEKEKAIADAGKRVREVFSQMDNVSSFGKKKEITRADSGHANTDNIDLSDISSTF